MEKRAEVSDERRMVILINRKTGEALLRRQVCEGLNASTLFNRAMQVYDRVMEAQEGGGSITINGEELRLS